MPQRTPGPAEGRSSPGPCNEMEYRSVELRQLLNGSIMALQEPGTLFHAVAHVAELRGKGASVIERGDEEK